MSVLTATAPAPPPRPRSRWSRSKNLGRIFDVSKPWLNRVIERLPRRLLVAAADVTFSIARRETFALVGESGSGKSTVAKMVVGLIAPTTGEVIDRRRVDEQSGARRRPRAACAAASR